MARTRFAPSPTGSLHVGGARTALYNYILAKNLGGQFILRAEDTDQERSSEEFLQSQLEDLRWLGILWEEGPLLKDEGPHKPYRQSQRLAIYKEQALRLVQMGKAYYCFCSDEELTQKRNQALASSASTQYDGTCRNLTNSAERLARGETAAIRFKVPTDKSYQFQDLIRGQVHFPEEMVGDFVLLRSDGMPVYNFGCVVDDGLMQISHVLRGEEHLNNTVRQLMLYEALRWKPPQFAHLSIILGADRQKLSKRHGATGCSEYRKQGYLPEALINFIALLGWTHPQEKEILTISELISHFSLERVHSSPAIFDEQKLRWINSMHLRQLPLDELWARLNPFLPAPVAAMGNENPQWRDKMLELFKPKMELLSDITLLSAPLCDESYLIKEESQEALKWESTANLIKAWVVKLSQSNEKFLSEELFKNLQKELQKEVGVKGKQLFQPLRVAVIGTPEGVDLAQLVPLLEIRSLIKRANICLTHCSTHC